MKLLKGMSESISKDKKERGYFLHETAIVDPSAKIGEGSKVWHFTHIMEGAVIGENCTLGQNVMVGRGVRIGNGVKVQNNVSLYSGVSCEDKVFIGPSVVFTNVKNPRSAISRRDSFMETTLRKGATIGANATVVCGNEIGAYAMVGAGAVVTKDVAPYSLVVGVPAHPIGWVSEWGNQLCFNEDGFATCEESGEGYQLKEGWKVVKLLERKS